MIEIAKDVAALFEPLVVPLMIVIAFGIWRLDRRLISVETIIERELAK